MLLDFFCDTDLFNTDESIYGAGERSDVALRYFMESPFYHNEMETHVNHLFNESRAPSSVFGFVSNPENLPQLKRMLKEGAQFRNLVVYRAEAYNTLGVLIYGYILPDERSRPSLDPCEIYIFQEETMTIYKLCDLASFEDMFAHNLCYSMYQAFKGWQRELRSSEAQGQW